MKISENDQKTKKTLLVLCGSVTGFICGLFGGGGGMICVPLLKKSGLNTKPSHATAIAVIFPVCVLSFLLYLWHGNADFSVIIPVSLGTVAGGILGAKLLQKASEKTLNLLFGILQIIAGVRLIIK